MIKNKEIKKKLKSILKQTIFYNMVIYSHANIFYQIIARQFKNFRLFSRSKSLLSDLNRYVVECVCVYIENLIMINVRGLNTHVWKKNKNKKEEEEEEKFNDNFRERLETQLYPCF